MYSQVFMTVVHGVVLQERTSLKQPAQVLRSQDVWVSGPMLVGGNIYLVRLGLRNPRKKERQIRVLSNNNHSNASIHSKHTNTSTSKQYSCVPRSIAGVPPSSQALLGFRITAPPPVCVPDIIGALAVWIQNQNKTKPLEGIA